MLAHSQIVEIFTYGGGSGLYDMFNAIAILTHPKSGIILPIAFLCIILGSFWGVIRTFFSQKLEALFLHFAIPCCMLWISLISISSPVLITDILAKTNYKVDNVPYLFALFCSVTSEIGYTFTKGLESILHKPNDPQYQKAGLIFGSQTALDFSKYKITNANLERNLNDFCKKCVFYDLSLGKYSVEDLKKTTDIWKFLQNNTSKCRLVDYCNSKEGEKASKEVKCQLMSCQKAIEKMGDDFSQEKRYYNTLDFVKQLPLTFQALTKLKVENKDLVSQQLMMNALTQSFPKRFAETRSKSYLSETYLMMGSSFQTGIVSIRIVLEAILYLSIVIVIPIALLPGGINTIKNWSLMYLWIQMWPPFFVIINYIFQIYAQGDANQIFAGLDQSQTGLSLYTSVGAIELYKDVLAKCGFAYTLVPMLSFAILKGGATSFVHLAGSFLQTEQSAASSATTEMLSGNYSYGNVQFGQMQYDNMNAFQNQTAPLLSDGYFQVNNGDVSKVFTPDRAILRENLSDLSSNLTFETSIGSQLHHSKQFAENQVSNWQQAYNESVSESQRYMHDLTSHLANGSSYSTNFSSREAHSAHEAASSIWNDAEQFANHYNISSSDVLRGMLGAKLFGTGVETGSESSNAELESKLQSYTTSTDFQERLERIKDYVKTGSYTDLKDEGSRIASSFAESIDKTESYQAGLSNAYSQLNQISETSDYFDNSLFATRQQITQDFVDFTYQKCQDEKFPWSAEEILTGKNCSLRDQFLEEFVQDYIARIEQQTPYGFIEPKNKYENASISKMNFDDRKETFASNYDIPAGQFSKLQKKLMDEGNEVSIRVGIGLDEVSSKNTFVTAKDKFDDTKEKYLHERIYDHSVKRVPEEIKKNCEAGLRWFPNLILLDPLDPD